MHLCAEHGAKMPDQEFALLSGGRNSSGNHARQFRAQTRMPFCFLVQHQKFNHLAIFASTESLVFCRSIARLAAERPEVTLAHYWIMRQQDARSKRDKSALNHVKIKLVLM
jgi:hypothetical protein